MDYRTKPGEETGAWAPACQICRERAVTRVPLAALRQQTVRRYIFGAQAQAGEVPLCGVCQLLHCEETLAGDGPILSRAGGEALRAEPEWDVDNAYNYAASLLGALERSGYHIFLRSDGRQLILSHQDGLDSPTRRQVERYRQQITEVIVARLWRKI